MQELIRRAREQQIDEEQYHHEDYEEDTWDEWVDNEEREYDDYLDEYHVLDDYEEEDEEELEYQNDEDDWDDENTLEDDEELDDSSLEAKTAGKQATSRASAILYNLQQDEQWAGLFALPRHRWFFILFTAVLVIIAASWNTKYNTQLRTLSHKEELLKDLRYRTLYTTAELVRLERINSIEERIRELNLSLEHSSQPPYQIVDTLNTKP